MDIIPRAMTGRASEVPKRYTFCLLIRAGSDCMQDKSYLVDGIGLNSRIDELSDKLALEILLLL